MGKVQGKGGVVKGDDSDGPKWPAPVRVEVFFLRKNLKLQRVMSRKTSEGEAEAVKEKRDRVGHPTADRPNSLPYYPRLWSSGTGVLSRNSLSQRLEPKATECRFSTPLPASQDLTVVFQPVSYVTTPA